MPKRRPNILYIMSDDHAANAISLYSSRLASVLRTPNIDRIGQEGALLQNCFCTNAICTPSRATILTGQYSHTNGVRTLKDPLDTYKNTFPQMLQESGYQTAVVGKWHVHSQPQGFDHYDILSGQGLYFDPEFIDNGIEWAKEGYPDTLSPGGYSGYPGERKRHRGHSTDIMTDKSLDWLDSRDSDAPFLLMCQYKAPHGNWEYHPRYENLFHGLPLDATGTSSEPTPAAWELYDLKKDPEELNNVYGNARYAAVADGLKRRLSAMKQTLGHTDDSYPELMKRRREAA